MRGAQTARDEILSNKAGDVEADVGRLSNKLGLQWVGVMVMVGGLEGCMQEGIWMESKRCTMTRVSSSRKFSPSSPCPTSA